MSELHFGQDVLEAVTPSLCNLSVHRGVPRQNEALKFAAGRWVIHDSFLAQVGSVATHALDDRLRGTPVPVRETRGWVNVGIHSALGQVVALVASTTESNNLDWADCLNNFLHGWREVLE